MLTSPCPNRQDLQPLVHLLKELQDAQSVSALRRYVRRLHQSIPAPLLARRTTRQPSPALSVVPLWLYPEDATLRWDNGQDFIIQLKSHTLARWDNATGNWVFCGHAELLVRRLLQWCRRGRSSPPRCTDSPPPHRSEDEGVNALSCTET